MGVFLNDTFTEAGADVLLTAHTGETGATWTLFGASSAPSVDATNDRVILTTAAVSSLAYASGAPAAADYEVQGVLDFGSTIDGLYVIAGRINTAAADFTYYGVGYSAIDLGGGAGWVMLKEINGAVTQLGATYSGETPTNGSSHTVKLSMVGTAIKGYVNGVERFSVTDSSLASAGRAGLRLYTGSGISTTAGGRLTSISADDGLAASGSLLLLPGLHRRY
jgi:hypothetical protein